MPWTTPPTRSRGHLQNPTSGTHVELHEDARLLGEARLEGDQWTVSWRPSESTQALDVVARDESGREARAHLDFQHLRFSDPHNLYASATLLTLPT